MKSLLRELAEAHLAVQYAEASLRLAKGEQMRLQSKLYECHLPYGQNVSVIIGDKAVTMRKTGHEVVYTVSAIHSPAE